MSAADLESVLRATLGRTIEVRPRRPNTLYQLEMPAFLADGDASAIFVRPEPDGRVLMTDLGKTCMRLSYTRSLTDELLAALDRLAERHGFRLEEGSLISRMPVTQVAAGALGLVQVEAEAEAVIGVAKARGEQARRFRDAARAAVERASAASARTRASVARAWIICWSISGVSMEPRGVPAATFAPISRYQA